MYHFNEFESYSLLKLFNMYPIVRVDNSKPYKSVYKQIQRGFICVNRFGEPIDVSSDTFDKIADTFITPYMSNQTLHKSFSVVESGNMEELIYQQIFHYMSTYGAEAAGINDFPTYIPMEKLEIPNSAMLPNINSVTVIRIVQDESVIVDTINNLLEKTVAPSRDMVTNIAFLADYIGNMLDNDFSSVKSFELKAILYKHFNIFPVENLEWLRYVIYSVTGNTLIIKNKKTFNAIRDCAEDYSVFLEDAFNKISEAKLAQIFYRFKPLFLAMRCSTTNSKINRIRRLAVKYHKPLPKYCLQNLTNIVKTEGFASSVVDSIIKDASLRDLVKIMQSIRTELDESNEYNVFSIRNGRTFVKENSYENTNYFNLTMLLTYVSDAYINRLTKKVKGKSFLLPSTLEYAVPTSEKQFIGNIPYGTRVPIYTNYAVLGIHWMNEDEDYRTDFDFHLNGIYGHYGWNGSFRATNNGIVYSGDMTNAPAPYGAAEAYKVTPGADMFIATVNRFSGNAKSFEFFMSKDSTVKTDRNYIFDTSKAVFPTFSIPFDSNSKENTIGLMTEDSFYFYGNSIGNGIVPKGEYKNFINGLACKLKNYQSVENSLFNAGAYIYYNEEDIPEGEEFVNLLPGALNKRTLLDIFD